MVENAGPKRVAKAVVYIDTEMLLLRDKQGWDLPGGHVAPDESMAAGLVREIEEETGLSVREESVGEPIYRHNHVEFYEIHLSLANTNIVLSEEHNSYKLIHPDKIESVRLSKRFSKAIEKTFE